MRKAFENNDHHKKMNSISRILLLLCFVPSLNAEEEKPGRNLNTYLIVLGALEEKGVLTCTLKVPKLPPDISERPDAHFEHLKKAWIKGRGFSIPLHCPAPFQGGNIVFSLPTDSLEGLTLQLDIHRNGIQDYENIIELSGYAKRLAEAERAFDDHLRKQNKDRMATPRKPPE